MAITFHCTHCGKKIEAQDSAGGKWGKCPSCHNKVYVPDIHVDSDLKLAPLDEKEEARRKQLMSETYKLSQDILRERGEANGPRGTGVSASRMSDKELTKNIILYLRQMADGELGDAQTISNLIAGCGNRAMKIIDRIALSEIPEPELADIPQQVLSGLIRDLRSKVS